MGEDLTVRGRRSGKAAADEAPERPERKIGRFVVDRELGAGGMGVVLSAYDPQLDRRVAIKLLHDDGDDEDGDTGAARVRLMREAQAMARLRHPNVVAVHEAGTHDGRVFIAMEFVPGGTLRSWLEAHESAGWREVLAMFVPAGRGLAAAHAAGLVHRDFKPDNVLVDEHGRVLVTDFGLAGAGGHAAPKGISGNSPLAQTLTQTGDVMGTPRYMPPEQHLAQPTDARSDQFAFCVALYEALFGVRAFAGEQYEVIKQHAIEGVLTPPRPGRAVPAPIEAAVRRGLRPDPAERFASMDELLLALAWRPASRRGWVIGGAGAVAAGGVVAVVVLAGGGRADPRKAAERAAHACDCELFTVEGGKVTGEKLQATGQIAVPRGAHLLHYDGYAYAVISAGDGAARTITLPVPETRAGFAFVPGGDVTLDDAEAPVHLEPYLIATTEAGSGTYAEALAMAGAARARLPTAAEWAWAAKLGVGEHMLGDAWEWTGGEDQLAAGETMEVRGGDRGVLQGQRAGEAEIRLARTPASLPPPREVEIHTIQQVSRPEPHTERTETVIAPADLVALHHFVVAWGQLDAPPALQLEPMNCLAVHALLDAGVDPTRIEVVKGKRSPGRAVVRWNPDPAFHSDGPPRCITEGPSDVTVLDRICFDGDALLAASEATVAEAASTLRDNASLRVEIVTQVPAGTADAVALTQRRAEILRQKLVDAGIAADRLTARGAGESAPAGAPAPPIDRGKRALLGIAGGEPCPAGDHVDLLTVE